MSTDGICPVCTGTTRVPAGDNQYKHVIAGYDKETDTFACTNCGGQTMYGRATGRVPLRADGSACRHEYVGRDAGQCYTVYTCRHCNHRYDIDSGD